VLDEMELPLMSALLIHLTSKIECLISLCLFHLKYLCKTDLECVKLILVSNVILE
jgi:hypothetical protein